MKIVFFTEAGSEYGYGHLMRCLALAQGFEEKNIKVSFVIRGTGNYSIILKAFPFIISEWLDAILINKYLSLGNVSIVDSYHANENLCELILKKSKFALFFDDSCRINYPGGAVINGVLGAENINYPDRPNLIYLLGVRFQPLRSEFWDIPKYFVRDRIENIMLTFGGSDVTNETPGYIFQVRKRWPETQISVVIGTGFKNIDAIEAIADDRVELYYNPDSMCMRSIMLNSDLAISAAGQTLSELARVGTPTIGVCVVENQRLNIKNWLESGFLLSSDSFFSNIPFDQRKLKSETGQKTIDGQGVRRIVDIILCLF